MNSLRVLLFPVAWPYGWAVRLRHWMFKSGLLRSEAFPIPIIGVGNLSLGGTGKTPFVEYLVSLLSNENKVATLSRGYGRKTKGFLIVDQFAGYEAVGDEPMQYFRKFNKKITVAVDEKRRRGVKHLMQNDIGLDVILLDDAFQHRYIKPGLSILLTDFHKLYAKDYLFPVGTLRDTVKVAHHADIIIITKSSKVLSPITRKNIEGLLKPEARQKLYFSYLKYGKFTQVFGTDKIAKPDKINTIVLFTGIANSYPLQEHLHDKCMELIVIDFADHHEFKRKDFQRIRKIFDDIYTPKKIVVTTEKDAMRLLNSPFINEFSGIPVFYLPVEMRLNTNDEEEFNQQIINYVKKNRRNG